MRRGNYRSVEVTAATLQKDRNRSYLLIYAKEQTTVTIGTGQQLVLDAGTFYEPRLAPTGTIDVQGRAVVVTNTSLESVLGRTSDYLRFDGVASYGQFSAVTLSGDFEISVDVMTTVTDTDLGLLDGSQFLDVGFDGYILLYVDNPDGLELLIGDAGTSFTRYIFGGQSQICNGLLNTVSVKRVGTQYSAYVNGVQIGSEVTGVTKDITIEGKFFGGVSRPIDGVGANLKLWSGGDSTTGTLVTNFLIDEKDSDTQQNLADVSNPMTLFNVDQNNDWVKL